MEARIEEVSEAEKEQLYNELLSYFEVMPIADVKTVKFVPDIRLTSIFGPTLNVEVGITATAKNIKISDKCIKILLNEKHPVEIFISKYDDMVDMSYVPKCNLFIHNHPEEYERFSHVDLIFLKHYNIKYGLLVVNSKPVQLIKLKHMPSR